MKKQILGFIAGIAVMSLLAMNQFYDPKKNTSEVEQVEGIYVFMDSKPVMEYEYLGTVKLSFASSSEYSDRRDGLIKKAKKEFPSAEAIMNLSLRPGQSDKADVIKFK